MHNSIHYDETENYVNKKVFIIIIIIIIIVIIKNGILLKRMWHFATRKHFLTAIHDNENLELVFGITE
jgi:flagellar basal body-associated protein FliL